MVKTEVCRKYVFLGRPEQRTIIYYLLREEHAPAPPSYGVGIAILETGEENELPGITFSQEAAERLADRLATDSATPKGMGAYLLGRKR